MNDVLLLANATDGLNPRGAWADWAGLIASIGCAIHCAAMPLVTAYLPFLGFEWLADEGFHRGMAIACFALAIAAFAPGWRKHRSLTPAIWGGAGLLLLTTAAFALEGNCCAACSTDDVAPPEATACNDASCPLCHAEEEAATGAEPAATPSTTTTSAATASTADSSGFSKSLVPFITPLGGLLLVVGHISNHRNSCRCQKNTCCLN
jgi:hypothetical protein